MTMKDQLAQVSMEKMALLIYCQQINMTMVAIKICLFPEMATRVHISSPGELTLNSNNNKGKFTE